jgi:D-glycero-alpha-D-manno-heptose-7-phosphate kinase
MRYKSVLSIAPLRISFVGGGTDISNFYSQNIGRVVSASIEKYIYVHVKRHDELFQEKYRVSYSEIEHSQSRSSIKNLIVKSCLEFLNIDEPLQISTSSDLPANSGLGSSSSFTVALLLALYKLNGKEVSPGQLSEEAAFIESIMLKKGSGKQDHYSASFGGINYFEFFQDESVKIQPIYGDIASNLLDHSLLIWSEQTREASKVLKDLEVNYKTNIDKLITLSNLATNFKVALNKKSTSLSDLGKIINEGWEIKKNLSDLIDFPGSTKISDILKQQNALGFKLLGAGSGGFFYAIFKSPATEAMLKIKGVKCFIPTIDHFGARIVSVI